MSQRKAIRRVSAKRLAANGGKMWSTIPSSSRRIRKKPRKKSERERIYGPPGFLDWIHAQRCVACGYSPSECAHIATGGTGRKADWTETVPLCGCRFWVEPESRSKYIGCHRVLHLEGIKTFQLMHDLDLDAAAKAIQSRWLEAHPKKEAK